MIQLQSDCLVFETSDGECIPCSAEWVAVELIGEAADELDPDLVHNASIAVLHYFKKELNRYSVSIGEFSQVLAKVLRGFGLNVVDSSDAANADSGVRSVEGNLLFLAMSSGAGFELAFYSDLQRMMKDKLEAAPECLQLTGLRGCVKELLGARRWSSRCQKLNDQIVAYIRRCFALNAPVRRCALVIR